MKEESTGGFSGKRGICLNHHKCPLYPRKRGGWWGKVSWLAALVTLCAFPPPYSLGAVASCRFPASKGFYTKFFLWSLYL